MASICVRLVAHQVLAGLRERAEFIVDTTGLDAPVAKLQRPIGVLLRRQRLDCCRPNGSGNISTPMIILTSLAIVVSLLTLLAADVPAVAVIDYKKLEFAASDENYPNPERGFYRQQNPFYIGTQRTPLATATLRAFRNEGISLLRAYYVFDEFRDGPLSQTALDGVSADFAAVRQAGIKIIPRFAYSFPCAGATEPCRLDVNEPSVADAPLARVLEHIDQLAPVLRAFSDVIAFMEMGFIGAWGEWHTSSNQLIANSSVNASSVAIVERVLWALPDNRMAAMRYPYNKQQIFGPTSLTAEQAFTGTPQSRLGAHNDCFLADNTSGGTYRAPVNVPINQNIETQRNYLAQDNRFLPQGGETCSSAPAAAPYIGCENALRDLELFHWSTLNVAYQAEVLGLWKQQGCFSEIQRRLGYRLRMVDADIPASVVRGAKLTLAFSITNDGWAAPYNPRGVVIGLRHLDSGRLFTTGANADPRRWGPGETHIVTAALTLPVDAEAGSYEVLFNLPDPEPTLYSRPEYSIRLANVDVWEASTGSNVLPTRINVTR